MLLNQRLKHFRTTSGLTQQQVADVLGLDRSTYAYYESGKTTPDIKSVNKLLKIFNISYYELMEEPDPTLSNVHDSDTQDDDEDKLHIYDLSKPEKRLVMVLEKIMQAEKTLEADEINVAAMIEKAVRDTQLTIITPDR